MSLRPVSYPFEEKPSGARPFAARSRRRGTASVEAVILLPLLVLLFLGVLYLRDVFLGVQRADLEARTCAWLYSDNGCTSVPPGCEGLVGPASSEVEVDSSVLQAFDEGARRAVEEGDASGFVQEVIGSVLGPALDEAFGNALEGRGQVRIERSPLFGGDVLTLFSRFRLSCNLTARTPGEVALESWGIFQP